MMANTNFTITDFTLYQKRGDTFDRMAAIPSIFNDGYFAGWTVKSQIRDSRYQKVIADLVCTWDDPLTTRILYIRDFDTTDWPPGNAVMDIEFHNDATGYVLSTNTLNVKITQDVTYTTLSGV
jgi:hypothetical protein